MENLGWIGSILLAFCGLPQCIDSIKSGNSKGLNWGFLLMWFFGEIFTFYYVANNIDLPLILNYGANIIFLIIIIKYKFWPRK